MILLSSSLISVGNAIRRLNHPDVLVGAHISGRRGARSENLVDIGLPIEQPGMYDPDTLRSFCARFESIEIRLASPGFMSGNMMRTM